MAGRHKASSKLSGWVSLMGVAVPFGGRLEIMTTSHLPLLGQPGPGHCMPAEQGLTGAIELPGSPRLLSVMVPWLSCRGLAGQPSPAIISRGGQCQVRLFAPSIDLFSMWENRMTPWNLRTLAASKGKVDGGGGSGG